jgi:threonine dehydrogenase-like Zn-dependent dehydrogenase
VQPAQATVECVVTSDGEHNVWFIGDESECAVIDPAGAVGDLLGHCDARRLRAILWTTLRPEFVGTAISLAAHTGAVTYLHTDDLVLWRQAEPEMRPQSSVPKGLVLNIGGVRFASIHTPGISPGAMCWHAAAGGVGLLLTQVLSARGVRVIGTTSTESKAALALGAGATEVIRYDKDDVAEEVARITDTQGVDVVYDGVGASTFDSSINSLRPRGMFVLYGAASGKVAPVDPLLLLAKGSLFFTRPSLAHYVAAQEELLERARDVFGWVASGELSVRVGARYSLDQVQQAHQDLESRLTTGKSLIIPR